MSRPTELSAPTPSDEARFRALADLSPDILSILDREGHLVFNSASAWKTHGYRAEDLQGRSTFDFVHPEDRTVFEATFVRLLHTPNEEARVRYRYRNADGSYSWMEATGRNETTNPILGGIIAISRDISTQMAAETALRDSEQRFRMLFATNPQPMTIFDLETLQFLEANEAALALYGHPREEFLRLRSREIRPDEDLARFDRVVELLRDGRTSGKLEHRARHCTKDGRLVDVVAFVQRIDWLGRTAALVLIQDVTEQLKLQTKLQQTQKLESLGLLAGGIAHDFNNMLTAILGHASIAADEVPGNSSVQESLRLIQESSLRAAELCRQMLAYSGQGRFQVSTFELGEFLKTAIDLVRITIRPTIAVQVDLAAGLPCIEGDRAQLQQVVMNLVLNAADAIGERAGVIRLAAHRERADRERFETMHLSPQLPEGDYVVLEVSDNGCGMTPDTIARIFDPFFTTKFTGRGLGLAAVLGIVRGHRGAIKVGSRPGHGTVFTILLPAAATTQPPPPRATPAATAARRRGRTILVVDDEESVRKTVRAMLTREGLALHFAEDGLAGVEAYREHHHTIDAVLLDLTMPRLGGAEAMDRILAINPRARVLLMSGFDEHVESARHAQRGQVGFVQKPFTSQALLEKIDLALAASPGS